MTIECQRMPDKLATIQKNAKPRHLRRFHGIIGWLPILLAAICAGAFLYQAKFNEQMRYYPFAWHARWMQSPYSDMPLACFRKTVYLDSNARAGYLVVAVDNYYTLYINGAQPKTFFHREAGATYLPPTPYTELGVERHKEAGVVFNIAPYLHSGRNVICLIAETDARHAPALAVEGMIRTARTQVVLSDSSWRCAPKEESNQGVDWTSETFADDNWGHAVATNIAEDGYVDGDPDMISAPMTGAFIGAPVIALDSDVHLRQVLDCPHTGSNSWMRIHWNTPYTLSLNGRIISSSMSFDRFQDPLIRPVPERSQDNLERIDSLSRVAEFPDAGTQLGQDVVICKDLFRGGTNVLEITLHGQDNPHFQRVPAVCLDGRIHWANGVDQTLQTGGDWQAKRGADSNWQPATVISSAYHDNLSSPVATAVPIFAEPDVGLYRVKALYMAGFGLGFLGIAILLSVAIHGVRGGLAPSKLGGILVTPMIMLVGAQFLKIVFAYSPQDEYFSSAAYGRLALIVSAIVWLVALVLMVCVSKFRKTTHASPSSLQQFANQYGFAFALGLIILTAGITCLRGLDINPFIPDEYVSILAARGILRHGIPIYDTNGIIYTRSALFHYILAAFVWLGIKTGNLGYARVPAVLWQLATLPVIYLFGRTLRSKYVGLAATAMVAFSPYMIFFAREARFYSQLVFFTTLLFYLLYKSIRQPENHRLRYGIVAAFCCSFLSQQIAAVSVIVIFIVVLLAGQMRYWFQRKMIPWLILAAVVVVVDLAAYLTWCVTPLPYVDRMSSPLLGIHTDYLDVLPQMLLDSVERSQLVVGLLYVSGLVSVLLALLRVRRIRRLVAGRLDDRAASAGPRGVTWPWWSYLYLITLVSVVLYTILIPDPKSRYICQIFPATALAACCTAAELGVILRRWSQTALKSRQAAFVVYAVYVIVLASLLVVEQRPVRTWNSTEHLVNNDFTEASRFLAAHRRPDDKIIYSSPEVAMVELGNCDFDWRPNEASLDKYMAKDGKLRERDSAGIVMDDVDKLRSTVSRYPRVWLVVVPRYALNSRLGTAVDLKKFIDDNFQIAYEGLGSEVCLWDRNYNHFHQTIPDRHHDQFLY